MPYIGQEPVAGNFVLLDAITTSATATYALTKNSVAYSPESSRNMIVSLNGVTQAPETAYTVSGSNITFSSALTASDVIDYILVLGDVLDIGRPSDGVVGTDQMNYPLGNFSSTGIDDNATSTAITIDASENVGIGNTETFQTGQSLSVGAGSSNSGVTIYSGTASQGRIYFGDTTTGAGQRAGQLYYDHSNDSMFIATGGDNPRVTVNSSGNVGIGNTSPSSFNQVGADTLVVGSGSGEQGITIYSGTANNGVLAFADGTTTTEQYQGYIGYNHSSNFMRFFTSATERMRIDSSGNLLVGSTTYNSANNGVYLGATGIVYSTATNSFAASLMRKTTDGAILRFEKDSVTVGSIGTSGGDLTIYSTAAGHCGLRFLGDPAIAPVNNSGVLVDNSVDIGESSNRFKDLYLSGGAYLGGTGAANHLDDYEEGTFTPTLYGGATAGTTTYSIQAGYYTKIGRMVHVTCMISYTSATGTGSYNIGGLPFTSANLNQHYSVGSILPSNLNYSSGTNLIPLQMVNTNIIIPFYVSDDGQADTQSIVNESANFRLSLTYYTS